MRIAFISLNGVGADDQELLKLGLTLPGFVDRSKVIASLPSLGLLTLAALTPEHELSYFEVATEAEAIAVPLDFDMAAVSTFTAQARLAYKIAARFKAAAVPVVMGGPHVSCLPNEALEFCDSVLIGEGEPIWRRVVEDCAGGRLRPTYGNMLGQFEMKDSPLPAFHLLEPERYNRLTVQTSRGCPLRCEFCAASVIFAPRYKHKPAEKVIEEIKAIKAIWRRPFIEFVDDNAMVDRAYWRRLLPLLKAEKVRWFAETDISLAEDDELLRLMAESGCMQVLIGLESPTVDGLDGLEMRSNWKLKRWSLYKSAIEKIQAKGIRVIGCFIVGLDGHGPWIFETILDFVREARLFDVQITIPTAFPGTAYYQRLIDEGRLLDERAWHKCTLFDVNFRPTHMSADELASGFRHLGIQLYSREFTAWRRESFNQLLKERRLNRAVAS